MYYVNKIVGWCLSPLGLFFMGLAGAYLLGRLGGRRAAFRRLGRAVAALAFALLWFLSCGISQRVVGLPLEGEEIDVSALPSAGAIVLLGGGMLVHETCGRPEICSGADRAWTAARLFRLGKAPRITTSGAAAPADMAFLADMGVDTNKVIALPVARNTEEEARLIVRALDEAKGEKTDGKARPRILLVTSAWHMPRARTLFERVGFEVIPAPTDYEFHAQAEAELSPGDFLPSADALARNSYAVKEWVARFCYAIKR